MNYVTNIIFFQSLFLIIWFETDAFVEYCRIIKPLCKWFKIKEFDEAYNNDFELTYHLFLRKTYNNFFVRLITCPICVSIWLSIVLSINDIIKMPMICIISLFIYYLFNRIRQ